MSMLAQHPMLSLIKANKIFKIFWGRKTLIAFFMSGFGGRGACLFAHEWFTRPMHIKIAINLGLQVVLDVGRILASTLLHAQDSSS